jgi:CDP-diacylglycerol--serine O-phosphatidyltransferase
MGGLRSGPPDRRISETAARRFRRGASLLPAMFTTGNLFFGFWSIVKTLNGQYAEAPLLIGVAIVLDMLDGRIARLTGTTSEFGGELDSLSDAISFGVAPALLAYRWGFEPVPRIGWLAAFLFVMCGVLRLARFNVQRHAVDGRYFIGLPIPAAAAQVAAVVHFMPEGIDERFASTLAVSGVVGLAFLMVSTLRYQSFKNFDLRRRRSYINVLGIAITFLLIALQPEVALLAIATFYALSGPLVYVFSLFRRRGDPPPAVAASEAHP